MRQNPWQEGVGVKRLADEINGLKIMDAPLAFIAPAPGDEHHRRMLPLRVLAQPAADLEPAQARHVHVGYDQVRGIPPHGVEGFLARGGKGVEGAAV